MPSSPYNSFLPDWRERLEARMKEKRYNKRSLSIAADLNPGAVSEWLNEKKGKEPSFGSMAAVAKVLQLSLDHFVSNATEPSIVLKDELTPVTIDHARLLGELRAGNWLEKDVYAVDETTLVPAFQHPDFAGIKQYAWRVSGNSMNRLAKHRSFVIGVSFHDIRRFRRLQTEDVVVCQRRNGSLYEYTMKRAILDGDVFRLEPESTDERHQKPVWLSTDAHGEDEDVAATHLIIGGFQFFI